MNTYKTLHDLTTHIIESYRADLETHDRTWIEQNPGVPFIHYTWDSGTYMIGLVAASEYPAPGEKIPYLFGHSDRDHILAQVQVIADLFILGEWAPHKNVVKAIHYFDGARIRPIAHVVAQDIARKYIHDIRAQWQGRRAQVTKTAEGALS